MKITDRCIPTFFIETLLLEIQYGCVSCLLFSVLPLFVYFFALPSLLTLQVLNLLFIFALLELSGHGRIEGNFHMVQAFAVFADGPTTAKIKTVNV